MNHRSVPVAPQLGHSGSSWRRREASRNRNDNQKVLVTPEQNRGHAAGSHGPERGGPGRYAKWTSSALVSSDADRGPYAGTHAMTADLA